MSNAIITMPVFRAMGARTVGNLFIRVPLFIVLMITGGFAVAQTDDRQSVGVVESQHGTALVLRAGTMEPEPLAAASVIFQGDIIETAKRSKLRLRFVDGSLVNVGEESILKITTFVFDPAEKQRSSLMTMTKGFFRAIVNFVAPGSTFEIESHTAVASVRATDWMGRIDDEKTEIFVTEGSVGVVSANGRLDGETVLTAGEGTTVPRNAPPAAAGRWGHDKLIRFREATSIR